MTKTAAEQRNREDIDRQVSMLARAYRNAGKACEVALHVEDSSTRGYAHYRLTVDGYSVTDWHRAKTVDVWLSLLDMRRAVEALDARGNDVQGDSCLACNAEPGEPCRDSCTARPDSCAVCAEPMSQEDDGSWSHDVNNAYADHEARPV